MKECQAGDNGRNRFEIKGYINGERTKVRGSKEVAVTTDEERARAVYNYLKNAGISEGQMEYSGGGEGAARSVVSVLRWFELGKGLFPPDLPFPPGDEEVSHSTRLGFTETVWM